MESTEATEREVNEKSEEQKRLIDETVANMKQMDRESLLILKGSAEVLKARDEMDRVTDTQDDG